MSKYEKNSKFRIVPGRQRSNDKIFEDKKLNILGFIFNFSLERKKETNGMSRSHPLL